MLIGLRDNRLKGKYEYDAVPSVRVRAHLDPWISAVSAQGGRRSKVVKALRAIFSFKSANPKPDTASEKLAEALANAIELRDKARGSLRKRTESFTKLSEQHAAARVTLKRNKEALDEAKKQVSAMRVELRALKADNAALLTAGSLGRYLAEGRGLTASFVQYMRDLLEGRDRLTARALAHALLEDPNTKLAGSLALAIHAFADVALVLTRNLLEQIDPVVCLTHAPMEYAGSYLNASVPNARAEIERLLETEFSSGSPQGWISIAEQCIAFEQFDLAARIFAQVEEIDGLEERLTPTAYRRFVWTRDQIARRSGSRVDHSDRPTIALIDYKSPDYDKASSNLGDYVQTLAFMANLARFSEVDFDDGSELGQFANSLRDRVAPERRIARPATKAKVVAIDRDYPSSNALPNPTWLFALGWYMHPSFKHFFDFPFPENVRPIFISFHINNRDLLTDRGVEYLKSHQPIGCRDWTTVYILRECGIRAFFSGCITSTISQLFSDKRPEVKQEIALVDTRIPPAEDKGVPRTTLVQVGQFVRDDDMITNMNGALDLLESYRGYAKIVTSRLHTYMPSRSLGLNVDFRPRKYSDVRFEGLLGIDDAEVLRIRTNIEEKVATLLDLILDGENEDAIYSKWEELCEDDLAVADRYCREYSPLPVPSFDVAATARSMRAGAVVFGRELAAGEDVVELAFATDENMAAHLPIVIESVLANTTRNIRCNVITRGVDERWMATVAADFPEASFRFYPCDHVGYGENLKMLAHTTISTMDRLLLPELIEHTGRIVYLDIDLLVLGDVGQLFDIDLEGAAIAGRTSVFATWRYGYQMAYRASLTLPHEEAWNLRRMLHAEGSLLFPAFNAGVLVMDLAKMREDNFCDRFIPLIERCAMNDQDVLNLYARDNRKPLDGQWNMVPSQDIVSDPKIIHWAGPVKPWSHLHILYKGLFEAYGDRYAARTAARRTITHQADDHDVLNQTQAYDRADLEGNSDRQTALSI